MISKRIGCYCDDLELVLPLAARLRWMGCDVTFISATLPAKLLRARGERVREPDRATMDFDLLLSVQAPGTDQPAMRGVLSCAIASDAVDEGVEAVAREVLKKFVPARA
jgi:hypothetical protein